MSEEAKKKLKDLAKQVREKVSTTGIAVLHQRGLELMEEIAKELSGPDSMPGLRVLRDSQTKIRLQRPMRNAEITIEWQREIGALSMTSEKHGEPKRLVRYVHEEAGNRWRRLDLAADASGELWEDITAALIEYLYPEGK